MLSQSDCWVLDDLPNQGPSYTQFDWTADSRKSPGGSRCLPFHSYCAPDNTQSFRNVFIPMVRPVPHR